MIVCLSTLRKCVLRTVKLSQPRFAVLENVAGLLPHLDGVKRIMKREVASDYHLILVTCSLVSLLSACVMSQVS